MDDTEVSPNEPEPAAPEGSECADEMPRENRWHRMRKHWVRWVVPPATILVAFIGVVSDTGGFYDMYRQHVLGDDPLPASYDAAAMGVFVASLTDTLAERTVELKLAHADEKALLQAQVDDLREKLANPEEAYALALEENARLTEQLREYDGQVPTEMINEALRALNEEFDRTKADALLAEVQALIQDRREKRRAELEELDRQDARASFARGEIAEAEVRWADAAEHYARAAELDPTLPSLAKASDFTMRAAAYSDADRWSRGYLDSARVNGTQTIIADALNARGMALAALGYWAEAEALYQEALKIDEATIGAMHPRYAEHLSSLGLVVAAQGRSVEAEGLYRQAIEIDKATIGDQHPAYAAHLSNLALSVSGQGRYAEAERLYRQAMTITRAVNGESHPRYSTQLNNLAFAVAAQEHFSEAEELYLQAKDIDRATLGADHPFFARDLSNLAVLYAQMGRFEAAIPMIEQALEIRARVLGPDHPITKSMRQSLANMRSDMGN